MGAAQWWPPRAHHHSCLPSLPPLLLVVHTAAPLLPPLPSTCSLLVSGSLAAWGGITPWDHTDYGDVQQLSEEPSGPQPSPLQLCNSCKAGCLTSRSSVCCGGKTYVNECVAGCCAPPEADCYEGAC